MAVLGEGDNDTPFRESGCSQGIALDGEVATTRVVGFSQTTLLTAVPSHVV